MSNKKTLVIYSSHKKNSTLSYNAGWPQAFVQRDGDSVILWNMADRNRVGDFKAWLGLKMSSLDRVVILHSAFSNSCEVPLWAQEAIARFDGIKTYFIGNEYKAMPEKMAFCRALDITLLITQNHTSKVHQLYSDKTGCKIGFIPNTGFDPKVFYPATPWDLREIDIGYRSYLGPLYLGHQEREEIAEKVKSSPGSAGLRLDFSMSEADRFDTQGWAHFLNRCKAQLSVESGSDYFELNDTIRMKVIQYIQENPSADFQVIHKRFFEPLANPVSCRCVSGRNVEAAATGTLQLMIKGEYGGLFEPDVHYVAINKDYSNIEECLDVFQDNDRTQKIIWAGVELARAEFTYPNLLARYDQLIKKLL